jgi:hypothetical protein
MKYSMLEHLKNPKIPLRALQGAPNILYLLNRKLFYGVILGAALWQLHPINAE